MPQRVAPYGSWTSPVTAELLAAGGIGLDQVAVHGGAVLWEEARPAEGGRAVVMSLERGERLQWTPDGFNVRTLVHEYGGGAFWVHAGSLYFCNFDDQRIYRQDGPGAPPVPITPAPAQPRALRYADGRVTPDGRFIVCVRERHEGGEVINDVVAVATDGSGEVAVLAAGNDFYAAPRPSPDGARLAFLTWNHPNMPWDGTELCVAGFADGRLTGSARVVAGGSSESIFQPSWSPDGTLHFVSDRSGWWNLYALGDGGARALCAMDAEFGTPHWRFDPSTYDFCDTGILCWYTADGTDHLALLEGGLRDQKLPYNEVRYPQVRAEGSKAAFIAAGPTEPPGVRLLDLISGELRTVRTSFEAGIDDDYISVAEPIAFPTAAGHEAHALFYRPRNPGYAGPPGARPPLLVMAHGGPTSQVTGGLSPPIQFWTTRGFAVVDVNYGGSSGYGRAYRERLRHNWGVVDVQDCAAAARFLIERGDADPARIAIRGGSAGGYTTLCSLAFTDVYAAGASYYGLGDLGAFVSITHKFESHYLDGLVGPWPEAAETYRERSAVPHAGRISCPVILFQGLEDAIVPPAQAEQVVEALDAKGLPYAYIAFEGEQHGFRRADSIRRAAEAELYFYGRIFGFEPADDLPAIDIRNLG